MEIGRINHARIRPKCRPHAIQWSPDEPHLVTTDGSPSPREPRVGIGGVVSAIRPSGGLELGGHDRDVVQKVGDIACIPKRRRRDYPRNP